MEPENEDQLHGTPPQAQLQQYLDMFYGITRSELIQQVRNLLGRVAASPLHEPLLQLIRAQRPNSNAAYVELESLALGQDFYLKMVLDSELPTGHAVDDAQVPAFKQLLIDVLRAAETTHIAGLPQDHQSLVRLPMTANPGTHNATFEEVTKDMLARYAASNFVQKHAKIVLGKEAGKKFDATQMRYMNHGRDDLQALGKKRRRLVNAMMCSNVQNSKPQKPDRLKVVRERIKTEAVKAELERTSNEEFYQTDMQRMRLLFLMKQFPDAMARSVNDAAATACCRGFNSVSNWLELKALKDGNENQQARFRAIMTDEVAIVQHCSPQIAKDFGRVLNNFFMTLALSEEQVQKALTHDADALAGLLEVTVKKLTGSALCNAAKQFLKQAAKALKHNAATIPNVTPGAVLKQCEDVVRGCTHLEGLGRQTSLASLSGTISDRLSSQVGPIDLAQVFTAETALPFNLPMEGDVAAQQVHLLRSGLVRNLAEAQTNQTSCNYWQELIYRHMRFPEDLRTGFPTAIHEMQPSPVVNPGFDVAEGDVAAAAAMQQQRASLWGGQHMDHAPLSRPQIQTKLLQGDAVILQLDHKVPGHVESPNSWEAQNRYHWLCMKADDVGNVSVHHAWIGEHNMRAEPARPMGEVLDDLYTFATPSPNAHAEQRGIPRTAGVPTQDQLKPLQEQRVDAIKRLLGDDKAAYVTTRCDNNGVRYKADHSMATREPALVTIQDGFAGPVGDFDAADNPAARRQAWADVHEGHPDRASYYSAVSELPDDAPGGRRSSYYSAADFDEAGQPGRVSAVAPEIDDELAAGPRAPEAAEPEGEHPPAPGVHELGATKWEKVKASVGAVLRVGAWGFGVAMVFLEGTPDTALKWIKSVGSLLHALADLPMLIAEVRAAIGIVFNQAWGIALLKKVTETTLLNCARVASVIGVIVAVVGFIMAVQSLVDAFKSGQDAGQKCLELLSCVSAGLGVAAALLTTIAAFKAGGLAALASSPLAAVALPIALFALGIGLIVGGIKMLCPASPNFPEYMREEWDRAWSTNGKWPSQWDLLTTGERWLAVGQIVIGGVELHDDREARARAKAGQDPESEDYIEAFLASFALTSRSDTKPMTRQSPLEGAMSLLRQMHAEDPEGFQATGAVIVNLGLLAPGAHRVLPSSSGMPEGVQGQGLVFSTESHDGQFLAAKHLKDELGDKLLDDIMPYLERAARAGTLRELPAMPSMAYRARVSSAAVLQNHVMLSPVLPGSVVGCTTDKAVVEAHSRVEKYSSGFAVLQPDGSIGNEIEVTKKPYYESDLFNGEEQGEPDATMDDGEEREGEVTELPAYLAPLIGGTSSDASAFDLSQMLELQAQLADVTGAMFDPARGVLFICDGSSKPLFPTAQLQDLAMLLKLVYFQPHRYAAFSLDPDDPDWDKLSPEETIEKCRRGDLHYKKQVWPKWLAGSALAEKLFEADYELKVWAAKGHGSVGGMPNEDGWTRVWLKNAIGKVLRHEVRCRHPNPNVKQLLVAITRIDVHVEVEARLIKNDGKGGMEDVRATPEQVAWAARFSQELKHLGGPVERLADVYRLLELVVAMKEHQMPVRYLAVEAMCLPDAHVSTHAPGRIITRGMQTFVGGAELSGSLDARRLQVQELDGDDPRVAWLQGLAKMDAIEPRPNFLCPRDRLDFAPVRRVAATTAVLVQNPFGPVGHRLRSNCAICQVKVYDETQRPHCVFQDNLGRLVCDRYGCITNAKQATGGCVLLSAKPICGYCIQPILDPRATGKIDEKPMRMLWPSGEGLKCFHGACYEKWPGHEDSDQKRHLAAVQTALSNVSTSLHARPFDESSAVEEQLVLLHNLGASPAVLQILGSTFKRYFRARQELGQDMLYLSPAPPMVALLAGEVDALANLVATESGTEPNAVQLPSLEAVCAHPFVGLPLDEITAKTIISRLSFCPDELYCASSCGICGTSLVNRLRLTVVPEETADDDVLVDEAQQELVPFCASCAALVRDGACTLKVQANFLHPGVVCDGCQRSPLPGPRFTSRDQLVDTDFCELCFQSADPDALPNMVVIDGPGSEGVQQLTQWRVALVNLAAKVLMQVQQAREQAEVKQLASEACQASDGHRVLVGGLQEAVSARGSSHKEAFQLAPSALDEESWLRKDLHEAHAEAWGEACEELASQLQVSEGKVQMCKKDLEEQLNQAELIHAQVGDVTTVSDMLSQGEWVETEASEEVLACEQQHNVAISNLHEMLRPMHLELCEGLRRRRVILCPVSETQHAGQFLSSQLQVRLPNSTTTFPMPVAEMLALEGLELRTFSDVMEIVDLRPQDIGAVFVDCLSTIDSARLAVQNLGLDGFAAGPCVIATSPTWLQNPEDQFADLVTPAAGLDNLDSFLGVWALPFGALAISREMLPTGEFAKTNRHKKRKMLPNCTEPGPAEIFQTLQVALCWEVDGDGSRVQCDVLTVGKDGTFLTLSVPTNPRPSTWRLSLSHNGSELELRTSFWSYLHAKMPLQPWLLKRLDAPAVDSVAERIRARCGLGNAAVCIVDSFDQAVDVCRAARLMPAFAADAAVGRVTTALQDPVLRGAEKELRAAHARQADARAKKNDARRIALSLKGELVAAKRDALRCNAQHRMANIRKLEAAVRRAAHAEECARAGQLPQQEEDMLQQDDAGEVALVLQLQTGSQTWPPPSLDEVATGMGAMDLG